LPLFDWLCKSGHYFEHALTLSEYRDIIPCQHKNKRGKKCTKKATRQYFTQGQARAQRFDPIVVHVDKDGNTRFPGRSDAKMPAGYERLELRTISEARAFERRYCQKLRDEHEVRDNERRQQFAINQAESRAELRAAMQHMSPKGRDFAQFAMERNNAKTRPSYEPNGYFECLEYDSSNRAAHNDAQTNWKDRK
jgi:hypothetical protein